MFDCIEEGNNQGRVFVLVKVIRNKRSRPAKILYLSNYPTIYQEEWSVDIKDAMKIDPRTIDYENIKTLILDRGIRCEVMWLPEKQDNDLPMTHLSWWDRIKVWYSRKVIGLNI